MTEPCHSRGCGCPWFGAIEHPFTRWHVELYAPPRPGVYALRTADRWISIGESESVQQRLLEHVLAPDAGIASHAPTMFGVELLRAEDAT
ncbi:MAG: hypothetical protein AB7F99_15495 [Vicinamibacterales bacterium]